jgi:hypothetical protein
MVLQSSKMNELIGDLWLLVLEKVYRCMESKIEDLIDGIEKEKRGIDRA